MNRRTFVGLAVTTAAQMRGSSKIGIGFLGASYSHAAGKLAVIRASADWQLIGVHEPDQKLAASLEGQGIPLLSREDLLKRRDIQVIAVESAVKNHAADGLAVLEAGKHLHLEKAPADTMHGFQEIVKTAQSKGLLLQVGYMWRHNPGFVKALEAAKAGWLGSVYMIRANIGNELAARRRPEWGIFPGGIIFELGCHVIDPMVRLMGPPRKVSPVLRRDGPFEDSLKDNAAVILEWDKALGVVQGTTLDPNSSRYRALEIHGSNGCAIVNPIEPPALRVDLAKAAGSYSAGQQKVAMPDYKRYVDDFIELAAAVRGEGKLGVTPQEELLVEETLLRCSQMA